MNKLFQAQTVVMGGTGAGRRLVTFCWMVFAILTLVAPTVLAQASPPQTSLPAPASPTDDVPGAGPTITPDELIRGQKGYGLSVFAGNEPERFEVEVLGVVRNMTPELSYIMARLTGKDLERSGVVAGMSGSPVYFDGRLAGAVAFSYNFSLDAIAGITPIGAMRQLSTLPAGTAPRSASGLSLELADLVSQDFPQDLVARQLAGWVPMVQNGARSSLQWTASGFGDSAMTLLRSSLGEVSPMGATGGGQRGGVEMLGADAMPGAEDLRPGSSVAAILVQGDLNLAAHGTVTDRDGDEILAFGHPMFSLGPVNLPLAASEVITIIANAASSFKVSNAGPMIGAFDQDREAGIRGFLGHSAPTTPLTVRLAGLTEHEYHMQVSNLPQMRPVLIAISALGAINSGTYSGGYQGLDVEARIALRGYSDVVARQSFDGDQSALDGIIYLLSYVAYLEFNAFTEVEIESVEVELTQVDRPRTETLLSAHTGRTRVEPGETVPVTLEFKAYRGEIFRRVVQVTVPDEVPEGRYVVLIGDGSSMDAARLSFEQREPHTFEQALEMLQSFHSRRELLTLGLVPKPGLAVGGEVLRDLPASMRSIFAAGGRSVGNSLWLDIVHQEMETLDDPISGLVRIDLEVRKP